ncbi:TonB-dependent siderophore receptor [Sinirhodobacter populi]|uniref:TonB-dependent siderophore receptor n=1 Tax=Paenirhodobacter populi TaxID=2306993 RepID=A0A443K4D1_9RHOB|nr:TonB-dependent siderophore receptor [Sinirhodobacter populi]RWR27647.1 TonB-dependent siderophore receptor [Sinirhodobacter populi]
MRRGIALLLSCSAMTLPSIALAQSADDDATPLATITVTGQADADDTSLVAQTNASGGKIASDTLDTAASVSVVTQKEIEARNANTIEQALSYTAGVKVDQWGNGDNRYDYYMIRGFDQMSTGAYRDGLPVYGDGWTYPRFETYGLERVEILKGSNASLFGLSAPGGIVNGITKTPKDAKFGEVYTTFGKDHAEIGTDFGDVSADGVWRYRFTAKWQDASGSMDHSRDDRRYVAAAVTWAPNGATELTLMADFSQRNGWPGKGFPGDVDLDTDTFLGEPDFNKFDTIQKNLGYQFRHDFGNGLTFRQIARYSWLDLTYEDVYGATEDASAARTAFSVDSDQRQFHLDNQLEYETDLAGMRSRTLAGIEYSWIKTNEDVRYGPASGIDIYNIAYCGRACITLYPYLDWSPKRETVSGYLQQELTIADRWILTVGGRYDNADVTVVDHNAGTTESKTFSDFTKRVGLTWKATDEVSVYGNYSESFEPNVWDLSEDAKRGKQYEVGVKYRPAGANALFSVAAFDLTQTNVESDISPTEKRQIGKVGVRGIEFEGKFEVTERFGLTAGYSWWDAEIREDGIGGNEGNRPANVPKTLASLWGDYTVQGNGARGDVNLGLGVRYVGSIWGDDANTVKVAGHTLFDAAVTYEVNEQTTLALNVSNLFDKEYVSTIYYGSMYYGDGRTVTASLRYKW